MMPPGTPGSLPFPAVKAFTRDDAGIVPPSGLSVKGMDCSEYVFTYYISGRHSGRTRIISGVPLFLNQKRACVLLHFLQFCRKMQRKKNKLHF